VFVLLDPRCPVEVLELGLRQLQLQLRRQVLHQGPTVTETEEDMGKHRETRLKRLFFDVLFALILFSEGVEERVLRSSRSPQKEKVVSGGF
jgi:hypothetical protein